MRTEYVTWVNGTDTYRGTDLEAAIRSWDANTYAETGATPVPGGIAVGMWDNGLMVRDGWIMHVHDNGVVFLNPSLREA